MRSSLTAATAARRSLDTNERVCRCRLVTNSRLVPQYPGGVIGLLRFNLGRLTPRPRAPLRVLATNFRRSCGPSRNDVVDDVLGIASDTAQQRRAQRKEEGKSDEVETGSGLDDAPIMNGNTAVGR